MPKILRADEKDFKALCKIYEREYGALTEARIRSYLQYNHIKLLKEQDKIIGVLFWFVRESPKHGLAEIEDFFIANEFRGQGLGSMLLASAIDDIRDYFKSVGYLARRIILFTGKKNHIARCCYEKHGFELLAEVGDLFADDPEVFYCLKMD
ncbi:MAG: GNAT family N-acetyltransferase [Candidatus Hodarchaeota archaeon]